MSKSSDRPYADTPEARLYRQEYGKVVAAEELTAVAEEIGQELVCPCVEEFGETFVKGGHHSGCWGAYMAIRLVREAATRLATT